MQGGKKEERLYLHDLYSKDIKKTAMPNMQDLISRHKSRYHLAAFLARPGMKVLDFPCGSGYGFDILEGVEYSGMDVDEATIEYAKYFYPGGKFYVDDMTGPKKLGKDYDLILCIDGPEHIEMDYHEQLIEKFYDALRSGGILLISMPEAPVESGPSLVNPFHLGELTFNDFASLLHTQFNNVQIITHEDTLHNGVKSTCMYAIARRGDD